MGFARFRFHPRKNYFWITKGKMSGRRTNDFLTKKKKNPLWENDWPISKGEPGVRVSRQRHPCYSFTWQPRSESQMCTKALSFITINFIKIRSLRCHGVFTPLCNGISSLWEGLPFHREVPRFSRGKHLKELSNLNTNHMIFLWRHMFHFYCYSLWWQMAVRFFYFFNKHSWSVPSRLRQCSIIS